MRIFLSNYKNLAPQNSNYISKDRGRLVDYIYVDNKKVRTNSNRLYQGVRSQVSKNGNTLTLSTLAGGNISYYEKAVLSPTRKVAYHYGRTEYGDVRYDSIEIDKENTNYLYYLKGTGELYDFINKYNGKVFTVKGGNNK